ncbi:MULTISPECIES: hypothetical protein [Acetobacter]|uniref:hypothetical protein n=1 Tax=Acetobacter TaxID=434 RepID=UPI0033A6EC05
MFGKLPQFITSFLKKNATESVIKGIAKNPHNIPKEVIEWAARVLRDPNAAFYLKKAAGLIMRLYRG